MRRPAQRFLIVLASIVAFVGLLEAGLRLAGFVHYPLRVRMVIWNTIEDRALESGEDLHRPSPYQLWEPRPGVALPWGEDEHVNAAGYRGPRLARQKQEGVFRVATLGDSSTFGMGVGDPETYARRLERELEQRGTRADVLNAGVIGFTVEQGLERYRELVRAHAPDVVIAAFGAINDHLQAEGPADREKIERHAKDSNAMARALDFLRYKVRVFHLAGFVVDRLNKQDRQAVARELKRLRREKRDLAVTMGRAEWNGVRRVSVARFRECLELLAARVREDGGELVLVSMPRNPDKEQEAPVLLEYNEAVRDVAAKLELPVFDARALVLSELARGSTWEELFLDYYHPTPLGHALFARELAKVVDPLARRD